MAVGGDGELMIPHLRERLGGWGAPFDRAGGGGAIGVCAAMARMKRVEPDLLGLVDWSIDVRMAYPYLKGGLQSQHALNPFGLIPVKE